VSIRNCGWSEQKARPSNPVWARRNIVSFECPKSSITRQSAYVLEQFKAWKRFGGEISSWIPAKLADALLILNHESKIEGQDGETQKQQFQQERGD
jgi:hypothetical protein